MLLWTSPEIKGFAVNQAAKLYPQVRSMMGIQDIIQEFAIGFVKLTEYFDETLADDPDKALMALFRNKVRWISTDLIRKAGTGVKMTQIGVDYGEGQTETTDKLEGEAPDETSHALAMQEIIDAQPRPLQALIHACLNGEQGTETRSFDLHGALGGVHPCNMSQLKSKFRKELEAVGQ